MVVGVGGGEAVLVCAWAAMLETMRHDKLMMPICILGVNFFFMV